MVELERELARREAELTAKIATGRKRYKKKMFMRIGHLRTNSPGIFVQVVVFAGWAYF